jgi:multidrug resistance efflux pump
MDGLHRRRVVWILDFTSSDYEDWSASVYQITSFGLWGTHCPDFLRDLAPLLRLPMSDTSTPSHTPSQHLRKLLGIAISLLIIAGAAVAAFFVQENIRINPRTEDAQVRANVIGISAQVGGAITAIHVKDNQQVHQGDLLLELDDRPYKAEVEKARAQLALTELEIHAYADQITEGEAALKESEANALYATNYAKRVASLIGGSFVTTDKNEQAQTQAQTAALKVEQDQAALSRARNLLGNSGDLNVRRVAAEATLRDAELKLSYCKVYSPCDGYVANLQIPPGVYASIGEQIFSIVDQRIWYVLASFRETDLRQMRSGMATDIYLMSEPGKVHHGIVQGIPKAIVALSSPSAITPGGQGLLSQVSPTIDFILLAQRYPVRIVIDEPEEHSFRMGGTASVIVHTRSDVVAGNQRLKELQKGAAPPFHSPAE